MKHLLITCSNGIEAGLSDQRLQVHTQSKTILRLNKTLQHHQQFLLFIQENKIHRLHEITSVAVHNNCCISYITQKVSDAIRGLYNPHYNKDDKDLAFLILQYGGPALLEIVHNVIKLPTCSTAYSMIKGKRTITTSVNATISESVLAANINVLETAPKHGHMLKIDEHYVDKRAWWCPMDNARGTDLTFNSFEDIHKIKSEVNMDHLHLTKECMVITTPSNSEIVNAQPIACLCI